MVVLLCGCDKRKPAEDDPRRVWGGNSVLCGLHESPADVYYGRRNETLDQRAVIKSRTMTQRKVQNLRLAG
ncbi:hypothetical protein BOW35_09060 [Solemya velum gill symbiont]|nr:hypothetical protein BOW02_10330 [Solemya velum gill symbiont]OOY61015.1 hypothetical protein BOW04_10040 [Solemya velum gill symbiont]OOY64045.1 hypothetical protein BOW05_10990 [Solemya velum gill symbiont]OOY71596.1 hypothetical protein BOW08_10240 [Solemya velum gill symbiont]OOY78449.1 hypothetical protein BOW11_11270 [Solemya velum gill symbiont]